MGDGRANVYKVGLLMCKCGAIRAPLSRCSGERDWRVCESSTNGTYTCKMLTAMGLLVKCGKSDGLVHVVAQ